MIFDTHAHYDDEQFDIDREELLGKMETEGIGMIVNAGSTIESWDRIKKLTEEYSFMYGSVGVHPDEVGTMNEQSFQRMGELLDCEKIVAVGEIGLDYYWDKEGHDLQRQWFIRQLELAREKNMPVIIHSRDAAKDTLDMMKEARAGEIGGVIHCFSYGTEIAREYLNLGFFLGIGGVLTFKNAKKLKEVAACAPIEQIVLETDCPYMAPTPHRGTRNTSANLPYVVNALAEIKGLTPEQVIEITEKNARRLYRMDVRAGAGQTGRQERTQGKNTDIVD